jgi:hypothetical protein
MPCRRQTALPFRPVNAVLASTERVVVPRHLRVPSDTEKGPCIFWLNAPLPPPLTGQPSTQASTQPPMLLIVQCFGLRHKPQALNFKAFMSRPQQLIAQLHSHFSAARTRASAFQQSQSASSGDVPLPNNRSTSDGVVATRVGTFNPEAYSLTRATCAP